MPYCPSCNFEYHRGITRCPDCGAALREGTPPPPKETPLPSPETESVPLCTVPDPTEAEIVRAALAEHGISALIRRQGPITGELGRVTDGLTDDYAIILVSRNRLVEARRILADLQSGPIEWPEGMEPDDRDEDEF